jgi:prepilin-type N-terminal cleavage/methylation domain-containing protein
MKILTNKKGFTLMELTIVLAVIAIIAAILIPTFLNTTDRARLRSDIASARVINNAVELYQAERGSAPSGFDTANIANTLTALQTAGFLTAAPPQSNGGAWQIHGTAPNRRVVVDVPEGLRSTALALATADHRYIIVAGAALSP